LKQIFFEVENVTKIRSSDGLDQLSPPEKRKKRKEKKRKKTLGGATMGWMKCLFVRPELDG